MKKFINFSNHPSSNWDEKQISEAKLYGEIVDIAFPEIDETCTENDIENLSKGYVDKIISLEPEAVMCQGEFTLAFNVVNKLMDKGVICLSACSKRVVEEKILADGSSEKKSIFIFEKFRRYGK